MNQHQPNINSSGTGISNSSNNEQADRDLAMNLLLNNAGSDALKLARLEQQLATQQQQQQQPFLPQQGGGGAAGTTGLASYTDMLRLQREIVNRELAARAALNSLGSIDPLYLRANSLASMQQQHPFAGLLTQQVPPNFCLPGGNPSAAAAGNVGASVVRGNSHRVSPSLRAASPSDHSSLSGNVAGFASGSAGMQQNSLKRASMTMAQRGSISAVGAMAAGVANSLDPPGQVSKKPRLGAPPGSPGTAMTASSRSLLSPGSPAHLQTQQLRRGSKAKLRDDFWGKVGKNNSHIHLVNIVLGRLLYDQVKNSKGGNKVLSNDLIQLILDTKLYGKYAVREFFANANKASETVRNTWTRLNFASDNIRKGLSRYKEQTWQAIERCPFEDIPKDDQKEMENALEIFEKSGRFVVALNVALKGIITEPFMGILMQLRLEWNELCLNCSPEEHDGVVAGFLRKYGLNGK